LIKGQVLAVVWFGSSPTPYPPSPISKLGWQERGEEGGGGAESYDHKKGWFSIKHSILSVWRMRFFAIDQYLPKSQTDLDNGHTDGKLLLLVLLKKKIKTHLSAPFQPPE
jgi:hypothetical protein